VSDPLEVPLTDPELAAEIALMVSLIVHANACDRRLNQVEIDTILGLIRDDPDGVPTRQEVGSIGPPIEDGSWIRTLRRVGAGSLAAIRGAVVRSRT
jgi:hypothetical protein